MFQIFFLVHKRELDKQNVPLGASSVGFRFNLNSNSIVTGNFYESFKLLFLEYLEVTKLNICNTEDLVLCEAFLEKSDILYAVCCAVSEADMRPLQCTIVNSELATKFI